MDKSANMLGPQQNFNSEVNVHVRCPDCFKLYAVKVSEIHEARPQFKCVDCSAQFWMPFPECLENAAGIIGFPVENARDTRAAQEAIQSKPFSCPKCGSGYSGGQTECEKCGVLFQKFFSKKSSRSDYSASKELKALWDAVILEYENEERHRAFIRYGFTDSNIEYVTRKYADVLDSNPSDEIALKFQAEIAALTVARVQASQVARSRGRGWQDWSIPKIRFSPILYVIAGILIVAGLVVPGMRNLIGFGCSVLFMALAIRFYFETTHKA